MIDCDCPSLIFNNNSEEGAFGVSRLHISCVSTLRAVRDECAGRPIKYNYVLGTIIKREGDFRLQL